MNCDSSKQLGKHWSFLFPTELSTESPFGSPRPLSLTPTSSPLSGPRVLPRETANSNTCEVCCCCCVASVVSDSVRPHRRQPTRPLCPWDSPGKSTGVGCHFLLQCMKVKSESEVARLCLTPSDPMDCSPPGPSIHGIFQARVLEWGATAFSLWGLVGA